MPASHDRVVGVLRTGSQTANSRSPIDGGETNTMLGSALGLWIALSDDNGRPGRSEARAPAPGSIRGWCSNGSRPSPRSSRRRGSRSTPAAASSPSRATPTFRPRITRARRPIGSACSRIAIGDGRPECVGSFFEGTRWTMNLAVARDGSVFVATRSALYRLEDRDGDGRADGTDGGKIPDADRPARHDGRLSPQRPLRLRVRLRWAWSTSAWARTSAPTIA